MRPLAFCLISTFTAAAVSTAIGVATGLQMANPVLATKDNGLMVNVPTIGYSRVETVDMCLQDAGVKVYQQLTTDNQFETFYGCLKDNT